MPLTQEDLNESSESSELIKTIKGPSDLKSTQSFIVAESLYTETKLILQRWLLMTLQMIAQLGSPVIALIFIGQLPDSAKYIAGCGLARTFVNVTGTAMAWGFTTALFTLLPQSIGAGHTKHASIHIQRSFYVVSVICCFLAIPQFFAGDIMVAIGQPEELRQIVSTYSRWFIPYIFFCAYGAIFTRLGQALDQNVGIAFSCFAMLASAPLFIWLFMFGFGFGYKGAAIAQTFSMGVFCVTNYAWLSYKGYGYIFHHQPLSIIWTRKGITQYINLSLPGLFQSSFQWIIEEMAILLAGWVAQPTTALSTSVILANVFYVVIPFAIGICNATNIRTGKYIGYGDVYKAKRAAKIGVSIAVILCVMWCLIFIFGRNDIPRIYTDDVQTIELTSKMMLIMTAYACGCFIQLTVGGIYRGLGFQKVAAVFTFVSFWLIAWPICMILLFGFGYRHSLLYGVTTIWCGLSLGNILASIGIIVYLLWFIDWNVAVKQSQSRVKRTMKDYQSTKSAGHSRGSLTDLP